MQNIVKTGLLVDGDFLINFKEKNLTEEEAMFLLQINFLTEQGTKVFSSKSIATSLNIKEEDVFIKLDMLLRKKVITLSSNSKIIFLIFNQQSEYYNNIRELYKVVESIVAKALTSKELDIITSWIDRKFTKKEIEEAFNISKNISYVNGILNNRMSRSENKKLDDDILGYDWYGK